MKKIKLLECPKCNGWGYLKHNVSKQCDLCLGKGKLSKEYLDYLGVKVDEK